MLLKLTLSSGRDQRLAQSTQHRFDQALVTVGRSAKNHLLLPDASCVISSRHAEFRASVKGWVLVDIGSRNGTILNEVPIETRTEYSLKDGDRIRIGQYELHFQAMPTTAPVSEVPMALPTLATQETEILLSRLEQRYAEQSLNWAFESQSELVDILREAIKGRPHHDARALLESVKAMVERDSGSPHYEKSQVLTPDPPEEAAAPTGVQAMLSDYCRDVSGLAAAKLRSEFLERVSEVLPILVGGLHHAIRGRYEFERQFEVETTRVFALSPNRLKAADTTEELAALLLDPRKHATEEVLADLRKLVSDVTLHPIGIVSGFRASLQALMVLLEPTRLEEQVRRQAAFVSLPGTSTRAQAAAWCAFKAEYERLTKEVNIFDGILAPHFANGYLSVQKAKSAR